MNSMHLHQKATLNKTYLLKAYDKILCELKLDLNNATNEEEIKALSEIALLLHKRTLRMPALIVSEHSLRLLELYWEARSYIS